MSELQHYGIKGQKWGERRWQYEDGTLTPEGKIRYRGYIDKKISDTISGTKKYSLETINKEYEKKERKGKLTEKKVKKIASDLSHYYVDALLSDASVKAGDKEASRIMNSKWDKAYLGLSPYYKACLDSLKTHQTAIKQSEIDKIISNTIKETEQILRSLNTTEVNMSHQEMTNIIKQMYKYDKMFKEAGL